MSGPAASEWSSALTTLRLSVCVSSFVPAGLMTYLTLTVVRFELDLSVLICQVFNEPLVPELCSPIGHLDFK